MTRSCEWRRDRGLTLVELLVTMGLMSVVGAMSTALLIAVLHAQSYTTADSNDRSALLVVLQRITKEVREAKSIALTSSGQQLTFWVDANRDGFQDNSELITYKLVSATNGQGQPTVEMVRSTAASAAGNVVAQNLVSGTLFTYTPAPPATTVLTITLTASSTTGGQTPAQRTVTTQIDLRNR